MTSTVCYAELISGYGCHFHDQRIRRRFGLSQMSRGRCPCWLVFVVRDGLDSASGGGGDLVGGGDAAGQIGATRKRMGDEVGGR